MSLSGALKKLGSLTHARRPQPVPDPYAHFLHFLDHLPIAPPLNIASDPSLSGPPTLNAILPGLLLRAMSGGPNTLLQIVYRMADRGIPLRIISADTPVDENEAGLWDHFGKLTGVGRRLPNVQLCSTADRSRPLAIGPRDVLFISAWWNVQMVKHVLRRAGRPFLYIIQDFEPGFYAWSAQHALALETYSLEHRAIFSSRLLAEFFFQNAIGKYAVPASQDQAVILETAVDASQFFYEPAARTPGRRRLLFYARPTTAERNLFEIGLHALGVAARRGLFGPDWTLQFIGDPIPPARLTDGLSIERTPWLGYNDYAALLRGSDVILSLMLSPHTSYPPLEMAACGGFAVTSIYANKTAAKLAALSPNIIGVPPTVDGVVAGLEEAVRRSAETRSPPLLSCPRSWNESIAPILDRVIEMFYECAHAGTG